MGIAFLFQAKKEGGGLRNVVAAFGGGGGGRHQNANSRGLKEGKRLQHKGKRRRIERWASMGSSNMCKQRGSPLLPIFLQK